MVLFETAESKARKAAQAAEEARRAAEDRKRLAARMEALLRNNRKAEAPAIGGDKRRWERAVGYNAGTARFNAGLETTCRVQDCAFGGMRLEFADARSWPDEFILSVPTLRFFGVVRSVWQDGCERGVEVVRWCETA
jgi:hypothetical protein